MSNEVDKTIAVTDDSRTERPGPSSRSRKGLGAKKKQAEKFRSKKNEAHFERTHEENRQLRDSFCKFDNYDEFLASLKIGEAVSHPPAEVEISVGAVEQLAVNTVAYLRTQKVEIVEEDVRTLQDVIELQIVSKAAHARRGGPFDDASTEDTLIETIDRHFTKGLKSTAVMVDQVGRFDYEGQAIYPKVVRKLMEPVPDGFVPTTMNTGNRRLYIRPSPGIGPGELANNPALIAQIPVDHIYWSENQTMSLTDSIQRYAHLLQRVMRKMSHAITDIDLVSGKGTASQIVGSCMDALYCQESAAWCKHPIPPSLLQLGAGFGFGANSSDYWHQSVGAHSTIRVDLTTFYQKLMRVNDRLARNETR